MGKPCHDHFLLMFSLTLLIFWPIDMELAVHTYIHTYMYLLDIPTQPTCMKLHTGEFYEHILSCTM